VALARAGGTVGEWAGALREVFGEYRAPTGVGAVAVPASDLATVRDRVQAATKALGGQLRLLVGKPGLDGHSNGAEQIAVAARDAGMEVVYQGIRLTPAEIAAAARDEDVDVVGLSILSGSHLALVPETLSALQGAGVSAPVVVGGIIPDADRAELEAMGVARVYTPKDFRLARIVADMAELARVHRLTTPQAGADSRR
jgi:(2R)-ethylmalonyl-CoA mutase